MTLEFTYTPDDLKESLQWQTAQNAKRRPVARARHAMLYWLMFVALSAILFVWLKASAVRPSAGAPPVRADNLLWEWVVALIPWLLIIALFLFALRVRGRRHTTLWNKLVELQQPQTLTLDDEGVRRSNVFCESLYRWPYFVKWAETKTLVILAIPGDLRLSIPKRAMATQLQLDELRRILQSRIRESAGGFPVIPITTEPAAPPDAIRWSLPGPTGRS